MRLAAANSNIVAANRHFHGNAFNTYYFNVANEKLKCGIREIQCSK